MKKLPLHVKIIIGLVLGIIWAFISSALGWNQFTIDWIDPFGQIFIRLLKFIAVPLVLFSIIDGVSGLNDTSKLGRMGAKTLGLYLVSTVTAITVGLLIVNFIAPGSHIDDAQRMKNRISYELWVQNTPGVEVKDGKNFLNDPAYADLVMEMSNGQELAAQQQTVEDKVALAKKQKEVPPLQFIVDMVPENIILSISDNKLMLQVIFFAIFFGITLAVVPNDKGAPVKNFISSINEVFLRMVDTIMAAAPFFVFALLAGVVAKMADSPAEVFQIFRGLGSYTITVLIGLGVMLFAFYPLVTSTFIKKISYKKFFKILSPAQFLAFSTSSSAATLPVTMECVEDGMGVSKNVSSFVLPIGATVNMDGTSLYLAIATVFLAQLHFVDLSLSQQLVIVLTATMGSIGTAAVPGASLVMLIIIIQTVGLNPAWIAIIFPVDRILDMTRTVANITGDATVATLIASSEGELRAED
ncbi:dicarboxylate/amino acid:cation symporter [Marinoscillum sp. 108]|uniref:dicarboxylate/amino acid:cation symporter n=1 Tax=Marinoscillum sp. 108 TaxID=2653151 RepID=UPI0012F3E152|nr:dicarboxylate/amino acid:cation symporter [Marinoscillum sp. 108]VXD20887.1 Na+/H+-dicarboxylate symporter [Marinoscillum sp. 108]